MPPPFFRDAAIRKLFLRSLIGWGLIRLLLGVFAAFAARFAAGGTEVGSPSPLTIVSLCVVVGLIDIRRRGERILWANLGISRRQLIAVFVVAAGLGETFLALSGLP